MVSKRTSPSSWRLSSCSSAPDSSWTRDNTGLQRVKVYCSANGSPPPLALPGDIIRVGLWHEKHIATRRRDVVHGPFLRRGSGPGAGRFAAGHATRAAFRCDPAQREIAARRNPEGGTRGERERRHPSGGPRGRTERGPRPRGPVRLLSDHGQENGRN